MVKRKKTTSSKFGRKASAGTSRSVASTGSLAKAAYVSKKAWKKTPVR